MRRTLLTASGWTAFIFAIYVFLGFRPAPPRHIGEGEICFRCHRVIADARLAAEMMDRNLPTKYKTSGCMARYVAAHPDTGSRYTSPTSPLAVSSRRSTPTSCRC